MDNEAQEEQEENERFLVESGPRWWRKKEYYDRIDGKWINVKTLKPASERLSFRLDAEMERVNAIAEAFQKIGDIITQRMREHEAANTGPLFAGGGEVDTAHIAEDSLWQLLSEGKATSEDQRFAAGWIAKLTLPKKSRRKKEDAPAIDTETTPAGTA